MNQPRPTFTAAEKLEALQRELALRRSVYPNLIRKGSMTKQAADRGIQIFENLVEEYTARARDEGALLV